MEAILDYQTHTMQDEYGNDLPLPIEELLAIAGRKRPLRHQGNTSITTRLLIDPDTYYLKRGRWPEDLIASAQDYRHECAITAAMHAFSWQLGPAEAYHVVGDDGLHYALISEVSGKNIEEPWAAAHRVSLLSAQAATLMEYALVILDRHFKNILVDTHQHVLHEIDFGSALDPEDGTHLMRSREPHLPPEKAYYSYARAIWEHHPARERTPGDEELIIPDTVLQTLLSREDAVMAALQPYALRQDERDLITRRFSYLRALYQSAPPSTIQGLNALVTRQSHQA